MKISAYLYDAKDSDQKIDLQESTLRNIKKDQLLWVDISERNRETLEYVCKLLDLENMPIKSILNISERPKLDKFKDFYRFFVKAVTTDESGKLKPVPIDYLVGENFVVTVHDDDADYFDEFRERENGETQIGDLDADSFIISLLDLHLVTYFRALENIEEKVDKLDEEILKKDLEDEDFLKKMVEMRRDVSKLRSWFLPHRDVFYALARPDFKPNADSDYQILNQHFENAVSAIESSRETVLSLFDLYTTKTAHRMNHIIKRLTFVTLLVGGMSVIAGTLGMNFKEDFFDTSNGFWIAIGIMILLVILLTAIGWKKKWI